MIDEDEILAMRARTEPNRAGGFPHPAITRDDVTRLCDALEQARADLALASEVIEAGTPHGVLGGPAVEYHDLLRRWRYRKPVQP